MADRPSAGLSAGPAAGGPRRPRPEDRAILIQTDCPLVGGDSGGPLLDLDGNVIGINSRIAGPTDVNLHVPVDIFREQWDRMVKGEAWQSTFPAATGRTSKSLSPGRPAANQCVVRIKCDGRTRRWGRSSDPTAGY